MDFVLRHTICPRLNCKLPGKNAICVIDDTNVARILDATTSTFKEDEIKISSDFEHSIASLDGSFLLTFSRHVDARKECVKLDVFLIHQDDDHRGIETKVGALISTALLGRFTPQMM